MIDNNSIINTFNKSNSTNYLINNNNLPGESKSNTAFDLNNDKNDLQVSKNKNKSYFYIKYGTGSIVGQPITDYFSLGKETYFNKNMSFGITLYEDSKVFSNVKKIF